MPWSKNLCCKTSAFPQSKNPFVVNLGDLAGESEDVTK